MLVTRSVHESMKSDLLQQLSCHLHSSRIPLPWPLLCVYAEKLTKQPSNPSRHSCFRLGGHCRLAFYFSSSTAVRVHIWCRLGNSGSQNVLDGSTMDAIVHDWFRSFAYFCQSLMLSFLRSKTHGSCNCFLCSDPRYRYRCLAYGKFVIVP